jgi:hypothetical protein
MARKPLIPAERVERLILLIRGQKVILDAELAELYGVPLKRLNQQVSRNSERFPDDFAFRLTLQEFGNLKSQFATPSSTWGGKRKLPWAFTEHGVVMAASVLNSPIAVSASIEVVRAFVRLRHVLASRADLAKKLDELEKRFGDHDKKFVMVFEAIRQLMAPATPPRGRIGFGREQEKA